jgi:ABC-type transport system substrate-binding protein
MGMTSVGGFFIPFEEWPQEVKNAYTYDPEGAEKLLDEAGYPRGSDGTRFKFALLRSSAQSDLSYDQLVASYWREIGVDMEIEIVDRPVVQAAIGARDFDMTGTRAAGVADPILSVGTLTSESQWNAVASNDPVYDGLYETALAAGTYEEQKQILIEMDMHVIRNHWVIWGPDTPLFHVTQPWIKGYNGEAGIGALKFPIFARLWIDQDVKQEMGS